MQRLPKKQPAEARLCGCTYSASYFNFQDRKYILLIGYPPADSVGSMGLGGQFENGRMPKKSHLTNGEKFPLRKLSITDFFLTLRQTESLRCYFISAPTGLWSKAQGWCAATAVAQHLPWANRALKDQPQRGCDPCDETQPRWG